MGFKSMSLAVLGAALLTVACAQSDAGITTAVKTNLAAADDVSASQIDVDTKRKVVTLSGSVETMTEKTRAVDLARATDGVASVVDHLTVKPPVTSAPSLEPDAAPAANTDPGLTMAVKTALLADPMVRGLKIDVDTANGVVTLNGEVQSQGEKDQALKLARETEGVKSVTDRLTVRP